MAKKTIQIQISKPCQEDFSKMTPVAKGKFCGSCEKVVTDFSRMSDQEIANFYLKNKGKICGRFHPSQLNRKISLDKPVVNSFFGKAAGVLLSGALSAGLANAASSELKVDPSIIEISDQTSSEEEIKDKSISSSKKYEIEILVRENHFKKGLEKANIVVGEKCFFTGKDGKVKIEIPDHLLKKGELKLDISHPDYLFREVFLKKEELEADTLIQIEIFAKEIILFMGDWTIISFENNNLIDRVKKFFFEKEEELQNDIINNNLKVFGLEPPPDLNDDVSKSDEPNSDVPLVPTLNVIINNIYPNPFIDKINLEITSEMEGEVQIRLFDISGRVVFQIKQNVVEGKQNIQLSPDISSAESNYFILQIQDENGNIQTRKIVRNLNGGFN